MAASTATPVSVSIPQNLDNAVKFDAIPEELITHPQWVLWKTLTRTGKLTKVPFQINDIEGDSSDFTKWTSYSEVVNVYNKGGYDGIGYTFDPLDPYAGVDLDKCINDDGSIKPKAKAILDELNSYSEISPSGTGVKIFLEAKLPVHVMKEDGKFQQGFIKKTGDLEFEVYYGDRFFTVTGNRLTDFSSAVEDRNGELTGIFKKVFKDRHYFDGEEENKPIEILIDDGPLSDDATERLQKLFSSDPVFKNDLFSPAPVGKRSDAEFHLCARLWEAGFSEAEIYQIMETSPQEKWHNMNDIYKKNTIQNAVATAKTNREKLHGDLQNVSELLKDFAEKVTADPGVLYEPDIYEPDIFKAIRDVYNNSPSEWLRIKKILLHEKISVREFVNELKEGEDDEAPPIESPFVELDNGRLAEMVVQDGIAMFAVYDPATQNVTYTRELEKDGIKITPPFVDEIFQKGYVTLPSIATDYIDETRLYEELRAFVHKYLQVSDDYESVACFYPMLTWVYDVMNVIAYLRAKGDWGVGKSRFLDVFKAICYRSIATTGTMSEAPIFRIMDKWKGTMIMDEGDLGKSRDSTAAMEKILVCGFERGKPIVRCNPNNPAEVNVFDPFGPKIIATRYAFRDKALESRCFTDILKEARRTDIPIELPPEFYEEAVQLRNKLLMYRFKNRAKIKARSDLGKIELDVKGLPKRIQQAARPISVILADRPDLLAELKTFMETKAKSMVAEASETLEGYIVRILATEKMITENDKLIWNSDFGSLIELIKSASGSYKLTVAMVRSRANSLGFKTEKGHQPDTQKRLITCEASVFESMKRRYIPDQKDDLRRYDDQDDIVGVGNKTLALVKDDSPQSERVFSSGGGIDRLNRLNAEEKSTSEDASLLRRSKYEIKCKCAEDVVNCLDKYADLIKTPVLGEYLPKFDISYVAVTCQLEERGWKLDILTRTMHKSETKAKPELLPEMIRVAAT